MKSFILLFFTVYFGTNCTAQSFNLKLIGKSISETRIIDSLGYKSIHLNAKSIKDETTRVIQKLAEIGYIETQTVESFKENEFSITTNLSLGKRIKYIHIYIGNTSEMKVLLEISSKTDSIFLPYQETELFLNEKLKKLEQKGYSLSTLKLINIVKKEQTLYAELQFITNKQRKLNSIVIQFQDTKNRNSFPKGHLKQINNKYRSQIFNQNIVNQIHTDFEKFGFINQIKYPEILFTTDSTKVYVYLEKRKSNNFDGFIGFSNNTNNKVVLTGYLDVTLENTLRAGEQLSIYWKNDGNKQKTFKAAIEIPYLFKSPIGIKAQLNIFKQDSIFQNTNTAINLGYYIDYNTRLFLGYQSTESSDIQNTNNISISDYKNSYFTLNSEFTKADINNAFLNKKTNISLTLGIGRRNTDNNPEIAKTSEQFYIKIQATHNFYLNKTNCIHIDLQNYYLKSDNYITNELFRFGGINSVRGFVENSLQANFMTALLTEYRYSLSSNLYLHTIVDYSIYRDPTRTELKNNKENIFGLGIGMGLLTKTGQLKIAIANGSSKNDDIKFSNTILNICYNVKF